MSTQMSREDVLRQKLEQLRSEHRDLDVAVTALEQDRMADQLTLKRLKKRKLSCGRLRKPERYLS